jgi:DNA-binding transcriptional ArsR family regulator
VEIQKDNTIEIKRLSRDDAYFSNVFKRTEKLVSVVFYILSHIDKGQKSNTHLEQIKDRGLHTHEASLRTLLLQPHEVVEGLESFQHDLLALESTIRVAEAAGIIPTSLTHMLFEQIDGVQRYITNHYTRKSGYLLEDMLNNDSARLLRSSSKKGGGVTPRRQRVRVPAGDISTDAYMVHSQLTDRSARIKTVLEAKPQATIKDISDIITDVSEKTIQRELNSLIEKGQVLREGERRWSRYSVVK